MLTPAANGAYIVRTAAQSAAVEHLSEDLAYLHKLWQHVRAQAAQALAGAIVHEELPLTLRILRDELARGVERVLVDSAVEHARMVHFAQSFVPDAVRCIELYGSKVIPLVRDMLA